MAYESKRHVARAGLMAALLAGLVACGGDATTAATDPSAAAPAALPLTSDPVAAAPAALPLTTDPSAVAPAALPVATSTVSAYAAARVVSAASAASLAGASRLALLDASSALAVLQLQADLVNPVGNKLVVPPLMKSAVRAVAAAASGEFRTQWLLRFPAEPRVDVSAAETGAVSRQLWAQRDHRFEHAFLAATDQGLGAPALAGWSAAQTDFSDGSYLADPAFAAGLMAAQPGLTLATLAFQRPDRIRLLLVDALAPALAWPAQTAFDGVFLDSKNDRFLLPMQRLRQGVLRHQGAGFVADALNLAGGSLLVIRPDAADLKAFAAGRLAPALAESVAALLGSGRATAAAGEIVLPLVTLALPHSVEDQARSGATALAFDEALANFKALDGGGSYLQTRARAQLDLRVDGLRLQAASLLAFTYSPLNIHAPDYGVVMTLVNGGPGAFSFFNPNSCAAREPDLRSFFLVLLDAQQGVLAISAIDAPGGERC